MGNSLGGRKSTKVMKINGETMKFKTPVQTQEVVKDYPGYVLLESESVKHYGIRAKPLELHQELKPRRLYFLVELPKIPEDNSRATRRVRSGINMSAKDRLESLMLARRSVSDLSLMRPPSIVAENSSGGGGGDEMRVKLRLPKAEVERLMRESQDDAEVAEKIVKLCMANNGGGGNGGGGGATKGKQQVHWEQDDHGRIGGGFKRREKQVGFLPVTRGEIQVAVA